MLFIYDRWAILQWYDKKIYKITNYFEETAHVYSAMWGKEAVYSVRG